MTPWETAKTTSATATVMSSAPRTSRRCASRDRAPARPRMAGARAAAARPTGTLTRNTARQLENWTRTPPRTWPATKPTDATAPYRPMARVRSGPGGKLVVMRDSAAGATMAAPAPWMTRAAISRAGSVASPPARLASAKATRPIMNMRRRPNRSAARPPRMSRPPKEIAYPVTIQPTASEAMFSSRSIEGRATLTMLKSSTTMNAATRMRASGRLRFGGPAGRAAVGTGVWEGAAADMIPIRYVTDRFVFQEGRTEG